MSTNLPRTGMTKVDVTELADVEATVNDNLDIINALMTLGAVGLLSARPAVGTSNRLFYATDTATVYFDNGSAWVALNAQDASAGTASQRTLGTGSQQAAAGDDARVRSSHQHALAPAVAASFSNVNVASPGSSIGGVSLSGSGPLRVVLAGQTSPAQNGPWSWNGSSSPMTRPTDFATSDDFVQGLTVDIIAGTYAGLSMVMSSYGAGALGTATQAWVAAGVSGGTDASKPAAANAPGVIWRATDTGIAYFSDGSSWITLAARSTDVQTFAANGTWTKPSGAKTIEVTLIDGGAGGEGKSSVNAAGGAGGRGGSFRLPATSVGATVAVTVGAGGAGGVKTGFQGGGDGGKSAFGSLQLLTAIPFDRGGSYIASGSNGSGGSGSGKGGFGSAAGGSYGGAGQFSAGGTGDYTGMGDGNQLSSGGGGGASAVTSGAGGSGVFGNGGNGASSGNASPGTGYGGGGGGAYNGNGGAGAPGLVIVTTYF